MLLPTRLALQRWYINYLNKPPPTSVESIALVSMPTKMNQIVQSFGNVVALKERVLEKMINLIYDKVGVRINQLDLGSRFGYIRADRILTVHDEFDPVVGLNHLDSIDPLLENHSFHLTKGLGHNRILKDSQTMEFVNKFLKKSPIEALNLKP